MQTVECGPKDVVWVGHDIRIFVTSRLDDLTLLVVTAPNGAAPFGLGCSARSAPADRWRTSHILPLCSGECFQIAGVSVRLEDCRVPDVGATPLRDRLLHIDAPPGLRVLRDSGAHRGTRAAARKRRLG